MLDLANLSNMIEFSPADKVKKMIFQGDHFNVVLICLGTGQETSSSRRL